MTLQKLTESEFDLILAKPKITLDDIKHLSKDEREEFSRRMSDMASSLQGNELDLFLEKIETVVTNAADMRNQQWEQNHIQIFAALSNFIRENNRIPSKNEIAAKTGISRQTVTKHLRGFGKTEQYQEERQKFKILGDKVLLALYKCACEGNVKAARLYFETTGQMVEKSTNNFFIQINNLRVDESMIKSLPPEKVRAIEDIIIQSIAAVQAPKPINSVFSG